MIDYSLNSQAPKEWNGKMGILFAMSSFTYHYFVLCYSLGLACSIFLIDMQICLTNPGCHKNPTKKNKQEFKIVQFLFWKKR